MKNTEQRSTRRNLMKMLTVSGASTVALQKSWSAPAVSSVMLPAHAQSSLLAEGAQLFGTAAFVENGANLQNGSDKSGYVFENIMEAVIPSVHAQGGVTGFLEIAVVILEEGAANYILKFTEMGPCIGSEISSGSMYEQSGFTSGEIKLGEEINTSVDWCDGGSFPLILGILAAGGDVRAQGEIFGTKEFDIELQSGNTMPVESPCMNCGGIGV